jgi:hypothetical protein
LLQAGVISTQPNSLPPIAAGRLNFPNRHPLNQTLRSVAAIGEADVIVGLEIANFFGATNVFRDQLERSSRPATKAGAKLITITAGDLVGKANYQDFQRYTEVHMALAGDGEATLPSLIEAIKRLITPDRRRAFDARGTKLADASRATLRSRAQRCRVCVGRVTDQHGTIRRGTVAADPSRRLVARERQFERVAVAPVELREVPPIHRRVWRIGHRLRYARVGWRRARKSQIRSTVGEHSERRRSDVRARRAVDRGASQDSAPDRRPQQPCLSRRDDAPAAHGETGAIAASIAPTSAMRSITPRIDYAKMAQSLGWYAEGPISNPNDLGPSLARAIAAVKRGEPALVDVITQPR